ncbi:MAG TPA: DUF2203 domain-containing protein [Dehalococcoidia bacterium]|jgi:hypothetical protein
MTLFTLAEAEALLPRLRDELLAMQSCKRKIDELRVDLSHAAERATGNGHVQDEETLGAKRRSAEALVDELNQRLTAINELGVELKGIDEGLLDFPSEREGRTVYLCWRLGEDRIEWWHETEAGFAGRQPLER